MRHLLLGTLISVLTCGAALADNTPDKLITRDISFGKGPLFFSATTLVYAAHSPFDIGTLASFLNGSLARTPSINPAFVEFALPAPVACDMMRIDLIGVRHAYRLSAAASVPDLTNRTGSYTILAEGITEDGVIIVLPATHVMARAFRLDARRLEGDDYVHFYAWQHAVPMAITGITAEVKVRIEHGPEPAAFVPFDQQITRPVDSLLTLRVTGAATDGTRYDVTDGARVTSGGRHVRRFEGGRLQFTAPESVAVTVTYANVTLAGRVTVTPRACSNAQADVDVQFIERLPRLDYDGPNGGWPTNRQPVLWRAHVKNWGDHAVTARARWLLDGRLVRQATLHIPPHAQVLPTLPWRWSPQRHTLRFEIEPLPGELVKDNNACELATDALTVGFYVERSLADFFHEHQHALGLDDANSFADWGQRQVRHWNHMLAAAVSPFTPSGCLDRVRLDRVRVVPDGALPMHGGIPSNNPNNHDKTVDLIWGFPYKFDQLSNGINLAAVKASIARDDWHWFFMDLGLFHELGHARYLCDGYGFDVHTDALTDLRDTQGAPVLGTYFQPRGVVRYNKYPGLMGGDYHQLSWFDAMMLNRVAGRRARGGNYNGPSVIGEFLQEIPTNFVLRFRGPHDEIIAAAPVAVFWANQMPDTWYGKSYTNALCRAYTTDANGEVRADRFLFARDGRIVHTYGYANSVPLLRVTQAGRDYFAFLEVSELNMLANTTNAPAPVVTITLPLRTGPPTPLAPEAGRIAMPPWRTVTPFAAPRSKQQ